MERYSQAIIIVEFIETVRWHQKQTGCAKIVHHHVWPNIIEFIERDMHIRPILKSSSHAHHYAHALVHAVEACAQIQVPVSLAQFLALLPE
jgi:hypothetical protein